MRLLDTNAAVTVRNATAKVVEVLGPTYGPAGKTVLLAQNEFSIQAVDDGKLAAQELELVNEHENAVVKYIREATKKTDERVGDGTTTATLILGALVAEITKDVHDPLAEKNHHSKIVEIKAGAEEAIKQLSKLSKPIKKKEELFEVCYQSFNDKEIATLVSDLVFKVGKEGSVTVEDSQASYTETDIVKGLELEKGYASPYFVNTEGETVTLKNPAILIVNSRIDSLQEFMPAIKALFDTNKTFVIVAEGFGEEVIGSLIINKLKGTVFPLLMEAPGYGENKVESMRDLAAVTKATLIDPKVIAIKDINPSYFGTVASVTSKKNVTTFVGGKGDITDRVSLLKTRLETAQTHEVERLERRIASLQGGIAVIKVGADTEQEQKTIKAKIQDAVNAAKVAMKEGVVPGAGKTLAAIKTSSPILDRALKAPREQLETNGKEYLKDVLDPTGVVKAALESAVSIACGLVAIGSIITTKREKEKQDLGDY